MGQRRRQNLCSQQGFLIFSIRGGPREPQAAPPWRGTPGRAAAALHTHVHCDNVTHTTREYLLYKYIEHTTST